MWENYFEIEPGIIQALVWPIIWIDIYLADKAIFNRWWFKVGRNALIMWRGGKGVYHMHSHLRTMGTRKNWIPSCAGMTKEESKTRHDG